MTEAISNNLVAFFIGKIEGRCYNCVDVEWEILKKCQDLYVLDA